MANRSENIRRSARNDGDDKARHDEGMNPVTSLLSHGDLTRELSLHISFLDVLNFRATCRDVLTAVSKAFVLCLPQYEPHFRDVCTTRMTELLLQHMTIQGISRCQFAPLYMLRSTLQFNSHEIDRFLLTCGLRHTDHATMFVPFMVDLIYTHMDGWQGYKTRMARLSAKQRVR